MSGPLWSTWRGALRPTRPPVALVWGDTPLTPRERGFAPLDSPDARSTTSGVGAHRDAPEPCPQTNNVGDTG